MNRRIWIAVASFVSLGILGLRLQPSPFTVIKSCVRQDSWPTDLFHLTNSADLRIFAAYVWIPLVLLKLRPKLGIPLDWIFYLLAAFIISCGLTHAVGVLTGYRPWYWLAYDVKEVTADVSLATAATLQWVVGPRLQAEAEKYRRAVDSERGRAQEAERGREAESRERQAAEHTAEELRRALEREQALAQVLAETSAPVLKLPNRTLALVVVGSVVAERAQTLMVRACQAVYSERARSLIIDVSAVPEMDTAAVGALGQVAQAVVNMGAKVVFAGIRAEVAMAMSRAGVRFEGSAGAALDAESAMAMLGDGVRSIGHRPGS